MAAPERERPPFFILRTENVSVLASLVALAATVALVYTLFPRRDQELMTQAAVEHRSDAPLDITDPSREELAAWSAGAVGADVPWPLPDGHDGHLRLLGARATEIMRRRTALVRYRVGEHEVSLVVQRTRDTPPRRIHRRDGDDLVIRWHHGKWTMVAVGPAASVREWAPALGAPL